MSVNQSGITTKTGLAENQILSAPELAYSLSCKVANTGVNAGADSKKIVKAGTPVYGSLTARDTAFTVSGAQEGAKPVGIVIHDVDVTKGTANAQVCAFGFVDISKLETEVATVLAAHTPIGITLMK